ncbi:aerobic cobaltochelatase CobT subunit [Vibrio lamellibrachiae]|uniref:cobaltochelatase CobT-related protein n=1 Tax=Vibrio lamellibrachiae TaxID=2910253 RepID=UPI003D147AF1
MSEQENVQKEKQMLELNAASARAMTNDASLHYRGKRLHRQDKALPIHAPHLQDSVSLQDQVQLQAPAQLGETPQQTALTHQQQFPFKRAISDAIALKLTFSDLILHKGLTPNNEIERLIFEMLEQFRVECLSPDSLPGIKLNLENLFIHWSQQYCLSGLIETRLGILLYTLAQICRSRLTGNAVLPETEDLIESTRAGLVPIIGTALAGLKKQKHSQKEFAFYALALAFTVSELITSESTDNIIEGLDDSDEKIKQSFSLLLNFDESDEQSIAQVATGESKLLSEVDSNYRIFTTNYDTEVHASTLVREALLKEYRKTLDQSIQHQGINIRRISKLLKEALAIKKQDGWQFGLEEGYIDGRRLPQIVSSPNERRIFKLDRDVIKTDSIISFLIDCSGSMKQHTHAVTMLIDIMTRAADMANVPTEVLGFTTNGWNGGRTYKEWMKQRRPKHPGRLNEVRHMIFKDADTSWRRARTNITALLKADLFKEGIDGEAVQWACQRLLKRDEKRRVLIVISDGCPMDTATNLCNDTFYLDNHLKETVSEYEKQRQVEILGLGVGLDLSPYYRRNIAVDLSQSLDNRLFFDLINLIRNR